MGNIAVYLIDLGADGNDSAGWAFINVKYEDASALETAEAILSTGDADLIAIARAIIYDPRWPWHAAAHFGAAVKAPSQYLRSQPRQYPHLFDVRADD